MLEIKVSLRIYTKGCNLGSVSSDLNCTEDFGYSEGDEIRVSSGRRYTQTLWEKKSTCENTGNLDTHITELLDWLETRKPEFKKLAAKSDVKSDLSCFLSSDNGQGSSIISSNVLKRVSDFDLDIVLDIYS